MVLNVEHLTHALDLVSPFILVATGPSPHTSAFSFSLSSSSSLSLENGDDGCATNFHDQETCTCERTYFSNILFINSSLCEYLGYMEPELGTRDDIREFEHTKKREDAAQRVKGNIRGIQDHEGKIECRVALQNAYGSEIHFYASGTIQDEVYILKLRVTTCDETELLHKFFQRNNLFMSIMETGPDDGTYEWRHLIPNKYVQAYFHQYGDTLDKFEAKKRTGDILRRDIYESLKQCKIMGDESTDLNKVTIPAVSCYLHTDPYTKRDVYGMVVWDFIKTRRESFRMADIARFFEEAPMMMGTVECRDDEIYIVHCNKAVARSYGLQEIPRYANIKKLPGSDDERMSYYLSIIRENRSTGNPVVHLYRSVDSQGQEVWLQSIISLLSYDKENNASQHAYCAVDMTAQKNAEIAMERHKHTLEETILMQEERFRSLVANAPNIILSIRKDGLINYANRSFSKGDGKKIVDKFLPSLVFEGPELMNKITALFETQQPFNTEVKLLDSDVWLNLNAGIMSKNLATVVATDITTQKLMAESLVHALSIRSRFLANMSHEVRTPLSGIIGMSRILMESGLTIDQSECVATIQNCGEQLLSVINDVLDYTKLEATGLKLDAAEFSLHQCAEQSVYAVLPAALKKNIELIIDIDHTVPDKVMGDVIRVQQVLINLLNNAVKFTDNGYIMVSLTGSEIAGAGLWKFYFAIKDTGCGIPKENQAKLFQMFSQVDPSTTRRYGGTGLGLALSKRFSEMMSGDVTMYSSGVPGEGSTFFFNLTAALIPFDNVVSPPHSHWFIGSTNIFILEKLSIAGTVLKKKLFGMGFKSTQICDGCNPEENFEGILKYVTSQCKSEPVIVFCNLEFVNSHFKHSLFENSNVALVLMAYMRPTNLTTDYPTHEYLRKPIKHNSLTKVLKDIWGRLNHVKHQPPKIVKKDTHPVYPLNIMVVEDNEMNQRVVRRVFQHLGYSDKIPMANHGQEALDMIEKNGLPDVILMDVQMPVLDGVETTKIIRSKYQADRPYIVSMTADAFPEDRQNCLNAGMNDFLTKPIRIEQVQAALAKCYKQKELAISR